MNSPTCDCGKCKKCKCRERNRRWRAVNPSGHRAACARWIASNPEHERTATSRTTDRRKRERDPEAVRGIDRARYQRDLEQRRALAAAQRERDRISGALAARQAVRLAIRRGEMARPNACEDCGAPDVPLADGRCSLHAHHEDYSKPLEVSWRCTKCHGVQHRRIAA